MLAMSQTNNPNLHPPTKTQLDAMFLAAEKPLRSSKQDSLLAVGGLAMIIQSAERHPVTREYCEERIKQKVEADAAFNETLDQNAPDYKKVRRLPIKIPDVQKMSEKAYWKSMRRGLIRVLSDYDTASEQHNVSRKESAVLFVLDRANGTLLTAPQDASAYMNAVGGMDRAIEIMRGSEETATKLEAAIDKKIKDDLAGRLQAASALASVSYDAGMDGPALILARKTGTTMEIIADVPLRSNKEAARLRPFATDLFPPCDPNCELLKQVVDLAPLVPEGAPTLRYVGGNHGGERQKVERALVLRPLASGASAGMLMISALHTAASPIIVVTPKSPAAFVASEEDLILGREPLGQLTRRYRVPDAYRFEQLAEDLPEWTTATNAMAASAPEHGLVVAWSPIDPACAPLEVNGFSNDASTSLTGTQLAELQEECLRAGAAGDDFVRVSSEPTGLQFRAASASGWIAQSPAPTRPIESHFRVADVDSVVEALLRDRVSTVTLSLDAEGPLRFAWDESLASYEVYLPQIMEGGSRDPRKMRKLLAAS
jgi:hypothetical protein